MDGELLAGAVDLTEDAAQKEDEAVVLSEAGRAEATATEKRGRLLSLSQFSYFFLCNDKCIVLI
jgi:hypothetical protein